MVARVQDQGLHSITAALNAYATVPKYLQWGTGTGANSSSGVTTTSTAESRVTGTTSVQTTTLTNDTFRVTGTITANNTRAITEVGVYDTAGTGNPPTGGNNCIYGDFSVINLSSGDSIAFTVNVRFS